MERRSGRRSSSVGSEKMERVGDRQGQMERYCSTGQSPQRAVAPTEEEEYILIVCVCMATVTEDFPRFFLSCKANARVKPAKTGHGQHSS